MSTYNLAFDQLKDHVGSQVHIRALCGRVTFFGELYYNECRNSFSVGIEGVDSQGRGCDSTIEIVQSDRVWTVFYHNDEEREDRIEITIS